MGLIADIGKVTFAAIKLIKKTAIEIQKEKTRAGKTLKQFRKELFDNREITGALLNGGKLQELKANDPALAKTLQRIKTAAMTEVSESPRAYKFKTSKKIAAFIDLISLTNNKIDNIKDLSTTNDRELALYPKLRLTVRVKNINQCLAKLINEVKGKREKVKVSEVSKRGLLVTR